MNFSCDKQYTFLRGYATGAQLPQTLRALSCARIMHAGQQRRSGEPYISHPLTVAITAASFGIRDDELLAAALLHDVSEDCGVSAEALPVSQPVRELVQRLSYRKDSQSLEQYYAAIAASPAAAFVKILDRCHNVSTMAGAFTPEKMSSYLEETETYVMPLFEGVKAERPELADALFLLKYHLESVMQALRIFLPVKEAV